MAAATLQRLGLGVLGAHGLRRASCGLKRSSSTFTNILADDDNPPPVQVASIADDGIHLADGLAIPGACIFLEGKVFLWDIPHTLWDGWGTHHFKLFEIGAPRPGTFITHKDPGYDLKVDAHTFRNFASGNRKSRLTTTASYKDTSQIIGYST